jgi:predicted small lipoprotein YifL
MSRRICVLSVVAASLLVSLAGCGGRANLTLNFVPNDVVTYKVSTQTIKDFRFEQPSLNPPKLSEQQSGTTIDVVFDQRIEKVDPDGSAVANVTIKDIIYIVKDKDDVRFDFDSQRASDKDQPFAKVVGQSYKIKISPDGKVQTVDAAAARNAVTAGFQGQIAKAFFSDERIADRHEIMALPDPGASDLKVKGSWNRVVPSPPGLLTPKSYQKVYTLTRVDGPKSNRIATVNMVAAESAKAADNAPEGIKGMGIFANMFDTKEAYTGKLVLETGTGKVLDYYEKLEAKYLAAEEPAGGSSDKGPDTLTMGFTYAVTVKAL